MGFAASISSKPVKRAVTSHAPVMLVTGMRDAMGRAVWYFVQVASAKCAAFRRQVTSGEIDFAQFGKVLASGFGENAPRYVIERMKRVYGFEE